MSSLVISSLHEILSEQEEDEIETNSFDESTCLIGTRTVIDSLGLVSLIINIEQKLSEHYRLSVTIADERALSREKSPFKTVGSLSDYISLLIDEKEQNV